MCLAGMAMNDVNPDGIVDFSNTVADVSVSGPAPERLVAGTPQQTARNYFSDATGQFFAGVWESTPGKWRVRYTETEFCHITRGVVHIEDAHGRGRTFRAGDSFVVPAGFVGTWDVQEPTSKLYVIFEPASK